MRLRGSPLLALVLASLALTGGCRGSAPRPGAATVQEPGDPAAGNAPAPVVLADLPYRVESESLETPVSDGPDLIVNRAFALFDHNTEVAWHQADAAGQVMGSEGSGGVVRTVSEGGLQSTGVAVHRTGQTTSGAVAGTEVASRLAGQGVAGEFQGGESHEGIVERGGKSGFAESGSQGERIASTGRGDVVTRGGKRDFVGGEGKGAVAVTGMERRWARLGGRHAFQGQAEYEDFLSQQASHLRTRNATLARLVLQDRLLRQIYGLSQEEFSRQVRSLTRERLDVLALRKSVSVEAIVPGHTFTYTLEIQNLTRSTARQVILYDEFPQRLQFENRSRSRIVRTDGAEVALAGDVSDLISFTTPNDWEAGKIAWHLPADYRLGAGDRLFLEFEATLYLDRGAPARAEVPLLEEDGSTVRARVGARDLVLVSTRSEDKLSLHVSVRRAGSGERLEGILRTADFQPEADEDATDVERRLQETVYFEKNTEGDR